MKFLEYADLKNKGIHYSRTQIWRKERDGSFPRRIPVGEGRIAWDEDEIENWMLARVKARDILSAT